MRLHSGSVGSRSLALASSLTKNPHGRPLAGRPDNETGSGAPLRSGWQFPSGSWMMRGGSRQSGRPIFGDPVPARKTVPDAAASSIRPPDRRRRDHPAASRALRNGIAKGPKRGPPANAIPAPESASPLTLLNPGTAGERVKCARAKRCFTPNQLVVVSVKFHERRGRNDTRPAFISSELSTAKTYLAKDRPYTIVLCSTNHVYRIEST